MKPDTPTTKLIEPIYLQQECVECLGLVDVINDLSIPNDQHDIHKPDQMNSSYNLKKGRKERSCNMKK